MKYILIFFITLNVLGNDKLFSKKVDTENPPANFLEISSSLSKTAAITSNFVQIKKIKALRRPLKSSGQLIFSNKQGVFWHLEKPYKSTIIINDKKMTSIDDNGKKVSFTAEEKPLLYNFTRIFMSIFTGKTEELQKHFDLYFEGNKNAWRIGLKPKSSKLGKVITSITLHGSDTLVKSLTIIEHNGDNTDISFSDIKTPSTLAVEDIKKFDF